MFEISFAVSNMHIAEWMIPAFEIVYIVFNFFINSSFVKIVYRRVDWVVVTMYVSCMMIISPFTFISTFSTWIEMKFELFPQLEDNKACIYFR